jgi:cytochrome c553
MEALATHVHEKDTNWHTCPCATGDPCTSCDEEHTAAAMAADAMDTFSELLSALGALHAKEGSQRSETMRSLGNNYSLRDDINLIAQHWERLASEKPNPSKLTKSERCRMERLRTVLGPKLAARVLPNLVSSSEREVMLASVKIFTSRSALDARIRDRDLGRN